MFVDSHCHLDRLDLSAYDGDFAALMAQTRDAGIQRMLSVGIDLEHYPAMRALVEPYAEVMVSVGVHPNEQQGREPSVEELVGLAQEDARIVAIGETGLDNHYNEGDLDWQRQRFANHIQAARACGKPLIIHSRDAREDTITIMREQDASAAGGVMHCFTENWDMARAALDLGFYISFSGIVTFKSAEELRDVARRVPLERLLIETDSPYLAPVPHRGKKNEPRFVSLVAEKIAEIRGLELAEVAEVTTRNFERLFLAASSVD
ncbi:MULTISPECIES: TatD family hydrolase [Thiorhodovibrio]|uniref:TatD family hydrolase n=1 Tax=Thiorhodovibrio TaxID=61593 RepID=UPI001913A6C9|nr:MULTISPECIES: TatD family hydrolase [Thiorhodovibrio]MBK5969572.1 TatD family deoxyribonuclease [Thiorhodovibrio winogradskyi]WPL13928.1 putative deoxyribonuclease YcfH [Thiorhodovibrio litoralis]